MNLLNRKFIGAISTSILSIILAQPANVIAQGDQRTRIDTTLVLLDVLVMDRTGRAVKGIEADKFELFIDGKKQRIDSFNAEQSPVTFGVVYDMHPTTFDRNRSVIESLREFKSNFVSDDDLFLAAFDMKGLQVFDFVPTLEQLERHMTDPATRNVRSLYDALDFASDRIQTSRHQKRVLLIISDSADHRSRNSLSKIRTKLMTFRTEVYAIVVRPDHQVGYADLTHDGRPRFPYASDATELERAALLDLTAMTGGAIFFGGSESSLRLAKIYEQIATEMRSHYTLGFYPEEVDGRRHNIKVKLRDVNGSKDMVLTYRTNYELNPRREF